MSFRGAKAAAAWDLRYGRFLMGGASLVGFQRQCAAVKAAFDRHVHASDARTTSIENGDLKHFANPGGSQLSVAVTRTSRALQQETGKHDHC